MKIPITEHFRKTIEEAEIFLEKELKDIGLSINWFRQNKARGISDILSKLSDEKKERIIMCLGLYKKALDYAFMKYRVENIEDKILREGMYKFDPVENILEEIPEEKGILDSIKNFIFKFKTQFKIQKVEIENKNKNK